MSFRAMPRWRSALAFDGSRESARSESDSAAVIAPSFKWQSARLLSNLLRKAESAPPGAHELPQSPVSTGRSHPQSRTRKRLPAPLRQRGHRGHTANTFNFGVFYLNFSERFAALIRLYTLTETREL